MLQLMKKMGNQSRDIHNIKETIAHFKTKKNTIPKLKKSLRELWEQTLKSYDDWEDLIEQKNYQDLQEYSAF